MSSLPTPTPMDSMDTSSDHQSSNKVDKTPRKPACDPCKERKTKCDRGSPCSSCKAAGLACRLSRNSTEKRQRILISAKYDEAIESIDRQLGQVLGIVQGIGHEGQQALPYHGGSPQQSIAGRTPSNIAAPQEEDSVTSRHAFQDSPSFTVQLGDILDTLGSIVQNPMVQERLGDDACRRISHQLREEIMPARPGQVTGTSTPPSLAVQHPELSSCQLPPPQLVLKILRLASTKRQRVFVDISVIDEPDFSELCQQVFFAISPYPLYAWIIVNVGLYYLLSDLPYSDYAELEITPQEVESNINLLKSNVEAAIRSVRVYVDYSERDCQALALLITFCMKTGHIARSWKLVSAASRSCLDLGLHRLPHGLSDPESTRNRKVFWYIYSVDKSLAFTLGRPSSIPNHEVTSERLSRPRELPGMPGKVYAKGEDYIMLLGEVHPQLFSAAAQNLASPVRHKLARNFAKRASDLQLDLEKIMQDPGGDERFPEVATLFDILLSSLQTVIWQIIPADDSDFNGGEGSSSSSGQYHPRCIQSARQTLTVLSKVGNIFHQASPSGWVSFLNIIFCFTPFVPFLVLVSNAVTNRSTGDLSLMSSALAVVEPVAAQSPLASSIYRTSLRLYNLAETVITGHVQHHNLGGHLGYDRSMSENSHPSHSSISPSSIDPLLHEIPQGHGGHVPMSSQPPGAATVGSLSGSVMSQVAMNQGLDLLTSSNNGFAGVQDWNSLVDTFGGDIGPDGTIYPGGSGMVG